MLSMLTDTKIARKDKALLGSTLSRRAAIGRRGSILGLGPAPLLFFSNLPFAKMRKILIVSEV